MHLLLTGAADAESDYDKCLTAAKDAVMTPEEFGCNNMINGGDPATDPAILDGTSTGMDTEKGDCAGCASNFMAIDSTDPLYEVFSNMKSDVMNSKLDGVRGTSVDK